MNFGCKATFNYVTNTNIILKLIFLDNSHFDFSWNDLNVFFSFQQLVESWFIEVNHNWIDSVEPKLINACYELMTCVNPHTS